MTIKSQKYRRSGDLHDKESMKDFLREDGRIQAGPTPTVLSYEFKFPIAASFSSCLLVGGAHVNFPCLLLLVKAQDVITLNLPSASSPRSHGCSLDVPPLVRGK